MRLLKIIYEGDNLNVKIPTSKERKYLVLNRLLEGEHLSYQRLADDYFVSRSSIANDIVFVKELLSKDGVPLVFDNSGTYIGGDERNKQKIIKRLVAEFSRTRSSPDLLLNIFIDQNLLLRVTNIFKQKIESWSLEVPENYLNDIVVSTSVVIYRGQNGHRIQQTGNSQLGKLFFQFEKYPLIYELLKTVEEVGLYKFSTEELKYLSYIVLGNGVKFFMKNTAIPNKFKLKVRSLIVSIGKDMKVDFSQDARLNTDLLLHLYQMVLRLQSDMTVINPLLSEIKRDYPKLFGVVWYSLREFGNDNDLTVSDDEVAFVTIHFQAAIERLKSVKRILFVCPNGIGTSSFISAKMHQILPNVSIIEVVSLADLVNQDLSDVELIITTVPIDNLGVPVAKISPMLTVNDMKTIMNQYIDLTMGSSLSFVKEDKELSGVFRLLKNHVFFKTMKTQKEAIDYLLKTNVWATQERFRAYKQTVIQRETLQSTYLGNGFAIPHGDPKLLLQSSISILILDKPVDWGNNKVDIISLLMVCEKDKEKIEPFMNMIMQGIKNKEWFISKMMEVR